MSWKDILIAIKIGIIPSKKELVDGTTQVGDSKKLGGKGAEEYALGTEVKQVTGTEITKSILQQALDVSEGVYNYTHIGGGSYPASDLPSINYAYSPATIIKRSSYDIVVILWGRKSGGYTYPTAINIYGDSGWNGWQTLATTADLANYLPLSGGRLDQGQSIRYRISANTLNAIGSWFENTDGSDAGGICAIGRNGVFEGLYMAVSPYHYDTSQGLLVTASDIVWKNNSLLHTGNIGSQTAGAASNLQGSFSYDVGTILINPGSGVVKHICNVTGDTAGLFPIVSNANSVLNINRHDGNYVSQLGFSSDGNLYYRNFEGMAMFAEMPWKTILDTGNSAKVVVSSTPLTAEGSVRVW